MVHEVVMGLAAGVVVVDVPVVVVGVVVVGVGVGVVLLPGVRVVVGVEGLPVGGVETDEVAVVVVVLVVVLGGGVVVVVGAAPAVEIEHETPFRDAVRSTMVPEGSGASLGVQEPAERFSTRARWFPLPSR